MIIVMIALIIIYASTIYHALYFLICSMTKSLTLYFIDIFYPFYTSKLQAQHTRQILLEQKYQ